MRDHVGIVCGNCAGLSPLGAPRCVLCGTALEIEGESTTPPESTTEVALGQQKEEAVEQARNYVCTQCSTPVPAGTKFCGACGAPAPDHVWKQDVSYFGAMQTPGQARLILIRGYNLDGGLTFLLQGQEHVAGRGEAQIPFPDDAWVSPKHASFVYRDDKLFVRDEGSANGVYVRVRGNTPLAMGGFFLCGEQVFRLDPIPADTSGPEADQTYFYSSPKRPSPFRITQVLTGGADAMVYCARDTAVRIGREESDMNFPDDIFMSGSHARVEAQGENFVLIDEDSRNGTYIRIADEHELQQGDYLFVGRQLLRVEMTS